MGRFSSEQLELEWSQILLSVPPVVLQEAQRLINQHAEEMATHFYTYMLQDSSASQYLSHDQVKTRLHSSMRNWMKTIFSVGPNDNLQAAVALQIKVGEVHARIALPIHIVLRGARGLKDKLQQLVQSGPKLTEAKNSDVLHLSYSIIDLAMEIMSQAYSSFHDRNARSEESYRLFSVAQNLATEREKQRAALLDWENQTMFLYAVERGAGKLPTLGASEFGLWFRHKGEHAFQGTLETNEIIENIEYIDKALVPVLSVNSTTTDEETQMLRLRELHEKTREIAYHLDNLFEQHDELEAGRDVLTRLLSRKFLTVVLNKEINYARRSGTQFAVVVMDIDNFKTINDGYGHETGDAVLQQLALILSNSSRGGDYIFRLGGDEFLLLLVDTKPEGAQRMTEVLRQKIANEVFRVPQSKTLQVTVSMGVALYDGHPDYQQTLRRADVALYEAKNLGRNQVALAD